MWHNAKYNKNDNSGSVVCSRSFCIQSMNLSWTIVGGWKDLAVKACSDSQVNILKSTFLLCYHMGKVNNSIEFDRTGERNEDQTHTFFR